MTTEHRDVREWTLVCTLGSTCTHRSKNWKHCPLLLPKLKETDYTCNSNGQMDFKDMQSCCGANTFDTAQKISLDLYSASILGADDACGKAVLNKYSAHCTAKLSLTWSSLIKSSGRSMFSESHFDYYWPIISSCSLCPQGFTQSAGVGSWGHLALVEHL